MCCKPSFVSSSQRASLQTKTKTIYLDPPSRTSSAQMGKRPTRNSIGLDRTIVTAWPCTRWGLPCHGPHSPRGALLPHHFTLTPGSLLTGARHPTRGHPAGGGIFSVALSLPSTNLFDTATWPGGHLEHIKQISAERWALPTTVIQWCSDFPPSARSEEQPSTHPANHIIHHIPPRSKKAAMIQDGE